MERKKAKEKQISGAYLKFTVWGLHCCWRITNLTLNSTENHQVFSQPSPDNGMDAVASRIWISKSFPSFSHKTPAKGSVCMQWTQLAMSFQPRSHTQVAISFRDVGEAAPEHWVRGVHPSPSRSINLSPHWSKDQNCWGRPTWLVSCCGCPSILSSKDP